MKKIVFIFLLISFSGVSQNKETNVILEEGKMLSRLEKASWYGTDDLLENHKEKIDSVGGYLSYQTKENKINAIFFSRYNSNDILIRYQFDSLPIPTPLKIDTQNNKASEIERSLITIRNDARNRVSQNANNFYTFYENTDFNFIPIIKNNERKVFILTGPQSGNYVLIGNDYILNYNKNNKFKSQEKIHNSILQFPFTSSNEDNPTVSTFHSHVLLQYISSTDICTLILYKDYVEWNQHTVVSEDTVSIFNLEKETLFIMSRKAWEKVSNYEK